MVKAVLFDLDETLLVRGEAIKAFITAQYNRHARALAGIDPERFRTRFLELEENGAVDKASVYAALVAELGITDLTAADLLADYQAIYPQFATLAVGARETLIALRRQGLATGIISNGNALVQNAKIDAAGLRSLADTVLVSEAEGLRKPDPAIFERAAERLGLVPSDCIFVGDNPEADIAGARGAGMLAIWYKGALAWPAGLEAPERTITAQSEVLDLPMLRRSAAA
jgi:putative hydrolase of the HAD superfamily